MTSTISKAEFSKGENGSRPARTRDSSGNPFNEEETDTVKGEDNKTDRPEEEN